MLLSRLVASVLGAVVVHAHVCLASAEDHPTTQSVSPRSAEPVFDFDIPTLPLTIALDRFAIVSGRAALYSSALAAGRTASAVRGRYTAPDGLARMLEGTGLALEEIATGPLVALVIKEGDVQSAAAEENVRNPLATTYDSLVQSEIWKALCADSHLALSEYRSLLRLEIDSAGRLERVRLLTSTGDPALDAALVSAVGKVRLDQGPPPGFSQPLTVLILPPRQGGPACQREVG